MWTARRLAFPHPVWSKRFQRLSLSDIHYLDLCSAKNGQ
jgi:hypothetical protein